MTYGTDAATSHISKAYCYLDTGVMQPVDTSDEMYRQDEQGIHPSLKQD